MEPDISLKIGDVSARINLVNGEYTFMRPGFPKYCKVQSAISIAAEWFNRYDLDFLLPVVNFAVDQYIEIEKYINLNYEPKIILRIANLFCALTEVNNS